MKNMLAGMCFGMALAGCGGGLRSGAPAEQFYVLHAAGTAATEKGKAADASNTEVVAAVIRVPRPVVHPGLDTDRIAVVRNGNELDYFASSRWGASLPKVLGALAVESLTRQGAFATVVSGETLGMRSDYELLLGGRHFEAFYASSQSLPVARVALDCTLTAGVPRKVLGSCAADAEVAVSENRLGAIVRALEQAAQQALDKAGDSAAVLARAQATNGAVAN
jgi:ABC-type uncharacterized transport system auxiliary subunit